MQEAAASELSSPPAQLPPLNNLPQWSRVNTFDKARYPKPFHKDRLQAPVSHNPGQDPYTRRGSNGSSGSNPDLDLPDTMNATQRVQHLERSIRFLTHQHKDILANLHDEIEKLKRANKGNNTQFFRRSNQPFAVLVALLCQHNHHLIALQVAGRFHSRPSLAWLLHLPCFCPFWHEEKLSPFLHKGKEIGHPKKQNWLPLNVRQEKQRIPNFTFATPSKSRKNEMRRPPPNQKQV